MGDISASALKSIESNSPEVSMSGEGMMMGTQRISVSDHMISGFTGKSDSIIVDLENFSSHGGGAGGTGGSDKDVNSISRIKLQRSLSRKVPNRSGGGGGDRDSIPAFSSSSASPRAAQTMVSSTPEKPASSAPHMVISLGPTEHNINGHQQQHPLNLQHQIAIIKTGAGHVSTTIAAPDSRWGRRSNSIKRSPPSRLLDPKRVLFFFATLSSLGTLLLIFFTLSISKTNDGEGGLDWQG